MPDVFLPCLNKDDDDDDLLRLKSQTILQVIITITISSNVIGV